MDWFESYEDSGSLILCGDYNRVMKLDERAGTLVREVEIVDIRNCMLECVVEDIKCSGNLFTWKNKQHGEAKLFSKLDRVLANQAWQECYGATKACFQSEGEFDHSRALITIHPGVKEGKRHFKYYTMWRGCPQYGNIVGKLGVYMYKVPRCLWLWRS